MRKKTNKKKELEVYKLTLKGLLIVLLGEDKGLEIYDKIELHARRHINTETPAIVFDSFGGSFIGVTNE